MRDLESDVVPENCGPLAPKFRRQRFAIRFPQKLLDKIGGDKQYRNVLLALVVFPT
jgi:hypothetical protein